MLPLSCDAKLWVGSGRPCIKAKAGYVGHTISCYGFLPWVIMAYFAAFVRCKTIGRIRQTIHISKLYMLPILSTVDFCRELRWFHLSSFWFVWSSDWFPHFVLQNFLFRLSSYSFVVFLPRLLFDLRQPVFNYGTLYTIQKKIGHATQG